jgi:peptidoglycan/xylan/chitin deacetylase (PgdA/CDA1 family)
MIRDSLQATVRRFHWLAFNRGLPSKIALYLHSLEPPTRKVLEPVVRHLRQHQYRFLTPDEYLAAREGRCAMVSFDDNYHSWHDALPWLKQLDLRVTFYVNTLPFRDRSSPAVIEDYYTRIAHGGDRTPLSTAELRDLAATGHVIASHSHAHRNLAALPGPDAREEIRRGKDELEQILGQPVVHFSYPYGMRRNFTPALAGYSREIGIQTIATGIPGLLHQPPAHGLIHRSPVREDCPLADQLRCLAVNGQWFERWTGRSPVG